MPKDMGTIVIILLLLWLALKDRQPQQISNEEQWSWVDWQGLERSITVHRNVRQQNGDG